MCNTDSVDEKLQRFSNASLSACCLCFKISSCEVGWRESAKLLTISIKPTCLKPEKCLMPLMRNVEKLVDQCCWRIPQSVSITLERSALQHVVKTPSSSLENNRNATHCVKQHICVWKMRAWRGLNLTWSKLKLLCCPFWNYWQHVNQSRTRGKEIHQMFNIELH